MPKDRCASRPPGPGPRCPAREPTVDLHPCAPSDSGHPQSCAADTCRHTCGGWRAGSSLWYTDDDQDILLYTLRLPAMRHQRAESAQKRNCLLYTSDAADDM
eukprot:14746272-Alexandrium_andersonii.AAC.1